MMENELLGFWRVKSIDMISDKVVTLIGGLVGDIVEFSSANQYSVHFLGRRPLSSCCASTKVGEVVELDFWIPGLESLVKRAIAKCTENTLLVCVAGNHGTRPTELRRNDAQLWALIEFERAERAPKKGKSKPAKQGRPLGFIPPGLISDDEKKA